MKTITVTVNGERYERDVEPRLLLSDFLRHHLGLTGTHVGCEHGVCGACTIQVDGRPVRACLMLAVQADGKDVRTVEALSGVTDERMHPLQEAFHEAHGLQCGFCTPGFLMSIEPILGEVPNLSDEELRSRLAGSICRCTGYQSIVEAVRIAAEKMDADSAASRSGGNGCGCDC